MYQIVYIMKAFAGLMIANFHSDIIFPNKLSLLAWGGDLGNNIFFMLSGFTLYKSIVSSKSFSKWYKRRLMRILPLLLIFYILNLLYLDYVFESVESIINFFVFPTYYWFTGAIIYFYILYYILVKKVNNISMYLVIIVVLTFAHLIFDNIFCERYIIGFISMMCGGLIFRYFSNNVISTKIMLSMIILSFIIYFVLKLLRNRGIEFFGIIHLMIGFSIILLSSFLILLGLFNENNIMEFFCKNIIIKKIVVAISEIPLVLYLFMGLNDRMIMKLIISNVNFPLSYFVNIFLSVGVSIVISRIDNYIRRSLEKKIEK